MTSLKTFNAFFLKTSFSDLTHCCTEPFICSIYVPMYGFHEADILFVLTLSTSTNNEKIANIIFLNQIMATLDTTSKKNHSITNCVLFVSRKTDILVHSSNALESKLICINMIA